MKRTLLLTLAISCLSFVFGQSISKNGGLTAEQIATLQDSYKSTGTEKALRNAVVANDINKLAKNYDNNTAFDAHFSNQVPSKAITDQASSGRCWMFTGMNVLRAKAIKKYDLPSDFQFSQCYTFFWDQLEKSNLFLQSILDNRNKSMEDETVKWLFQNPLGDGGQFTGVANLISKYGIMPKEAMPETYSSNHTSQMSSLIKLRLHEDGLILREMANNKSTTEKMLQDKKMEMLKVIYKMLVFTLGEPPAEFTWTQRNAKGEIVSTDKYTPKSFAEQLGLNMDDYVSLTSYTHHPFNEWFVIESPYKWRLKPSYNIPIEQLMEVIDTAIDAGYTVAWGGDVTGDFTRTGLAMLPDSITPTQQLRQEQWDDWRFTYDHVMLIYGKAVDEQGKPYYMVKNSWGPMGDYQGIWYMSRDYMMLNTTYLFLNRHALPEDIRKEL